MKIIFLDIDGVLNNWASIAENIHILNDKCLLIRRIIEETGAKIVISSTWRLNSTVDELNKMLWSVGIPYNSVISKTPSMTGIRGVEIETWLKDNDQVERYCIIDDDSDFLDYQKKYFVQTNMKSGLTTKLAKQAINILNTK